MILWVSVKNSIHHWHCVKIRLGTLKVIGILQGISGQPTYCNFICWKLFMKTSAASAAIFIFLRKTTNAELVFIVFRNTPPLYFIQKRKRKIWLERFVILYIVFDYLKHNQLEFRRETILFVDVVHLYVSYFYDTLMIRYSIWYDILVIIARFCDNKEEFLKMSNLSRGHFHKTILWLTSVTRPNFVIRSILAVSRNFHI